MTMTDNNTEPQHLQEMLTAEEIIAKTKISRSSLFRLEDKGLFPKGHALMKNHRLWFINEVIAWQRDLADPNSELSKKLIELGFRQPGPGGQLNE